jgi:hypothetical protein
VRRKEGNSLFAVPSVSLSFPLSLSFLVTGRSQADSFHLLGGGITRGTVARSGRLRCDMSGHLQIDQRPGSGVLVG